MIAWTLFYNPVTMPSMSLLWMLIPLCLLVSIVYKTCRVQDLGMLWAEILKMFGCIIGGLIAIGGIMYLVLGYWP